jgi:hypothetical protein
MASQMASFLDQAGGLWMRGALNGKVGGAFTSTGSQHGGQEVTLFSIITNLMHFGMTIVGLPYSFQGQMTLDEIAGGSPYGATTIAGGSGQRQPSAIELAGARHQGMLIAQTAAKLAAHERPAGSPDGVCGGASTARRGAYPWREHRAPWRVPVARAPRAVARTRVDRAPNNSARADTRRYAGR